MKRTHAHTAKATWREEGPPRGATVHQRDVAAGGVTQQCAHDAVAWEGCVRNPSSRALAVAPSAAESGRHHNEAPNEEPPTPRTPRQRAAVMVVV